MHGGLVHHATVTAARSNDDDVQCPDAAVQTMRCAHVADVCFRAGARVSLRWKNQRRSEMQGSIHRFAAFVVRLTACFHDVLVPV
jgi:hypothetical protein